jgi:heptosyltransferase-2/heptosyltransferase-3
MSGSGTAAGTRPLVVRLGALGDMVMLAPALRALARRHGAPCDLVTTPLAPAEVLRGLPYVGEVLALRSRSTPYWLDPKQRRIVGWLRARPPGPVWLFDPSAKLTWLLDRGGVDSRARLTTDDVPRGDLEHAAAHALRFLAQEPSAEAAPAPAAPPPLDESSSWPDLAPTDEERAECLSWLEKRGLAERPLVLLQALTRNPRRGRWPLDRWLAAIRAVLETLPGARVLLLGAWWERLRVRALARACRDARVIDAAGQVPIRTLVALCAYAHSFVSMDTGPAHVAAAVGCPLVVLIGRADPRRNRPLGPGPKRLVTAWPEQTWPATRAEWEAEHRVESLRVDSVVEAWREVIVR